METVTVALGERSYPIYIGSDILSSPALLTKHIKGSQVLVVTNEVVARHYLPKVLSTLKNYQCDTLILPEGEAHKTLATLELVYDALMTNRHNRTTTLIALGGGVIGDITGFAAASFQRGVNFIQIPTTILSQVDSSVGGKTGVNHPLGKNMIGAFHQPQCVLIDTDTLATLPSREVSAGLAEVVKYGLINDAPFYYWLDEHIDDLLALKMEPLSYAIKRSCECKAEIVAADERESGVRALLNLGHTFGHAIESNQGYGKYVHGEAVAIGMHMAADLSFRLGCLTAAEAISVGRLLKKAKLPVFPPAEMTADDFMAAMAVDKKVTNGHLRLILMKGVGKAYLTDEFSPELLSQTLSAGTALCSVLET